MDADQEWAPYLSLHDAYKLNDVRDALRRGDLKAASWQARVFTMRPLPYHINEVQQGAQLCFGVRHHFARPVKNIAAWILLPALPTQAG